MVNDAFFDETTEQSAAKAEIVAKYFWAWAKVIMPTVKRRGERIAYIDLFAGPGRYQDGTKSTPLLVLERAIQDVDMRQLLVAIFNDADVNNTRSLDAAIQALPEIGLLRYRPQVANREIGTEIVRQFEGMRLVPTFFFVDPWGYKGLSLRLINSVLRNWGCDCIFVFNYNRINMGLKNDHVREHIDALFGSARANDLRARLGVSSPGEREAAIVEGICGALHDLGGKYVLPFCFKTARGTRTSHYLIFVSKHFLGYEIMKKVMAGESSSAQQGVPSFTFCPLDAQRPVLFEMDRPLDDLEGRLLELFAGQQLSMRTIYEQHNVGTRYIKRNYKDVLRRLEAQGKIVAGPPATRRPRHNGEISFADTVLVTFPPLR